MAIAFVASIAAQGVSASSVTTGSIDTTGANLLIAACATLTQSLFTSVTDSKSNTWSNAVGPITTNDAEDEARQQYAENPGSVGTSHTATLTLSAADFPTIVFSSFSGAATSTVLDQTATLGETAGATSHPSGTTATLAQADEMAYANMAIHGGGALADSDAGFTYDQEHEGATGESIASAYQILSATTGIQINAFTSVNSVKAAIVIATYKAASVGGGSFLLMLNPNLRGGLGGLRTGIQ